MGKKTYGQSKRFTVTEAQAALLLRMIGHCRKDKAFADTNANLWRALERNIRNAEAIDAAPTTSATADIVAGFDEADGNGHRRTHWTTCDNCGADKTSEAFAQPCPGPKASGPERDPRDVRATQQAFLDIHEGRALVGSEASIAAQRQRRS